MRIKLSDMGLAKKLSNERSSFSTNSMGTIGWQAPEMIAPLANLEKGSTVPLPRITKKVDIFSLGCVIHYVLTKKHPFGEHYERQINSMKGLAQITALDIADPIAADLVRRCVALNSDERSDRASSYICELFLCLM